MSGVLGGLMKYIYELARTYNFHRLAVACASVRVLASRSLELRWNDRES